MLTRLLSPLTEPAYALLRVVAGTLFLCHGGEKLLGWFGGGSAPKILSQMWFGGVIELVGGLLIALGLFTRCAAFVASGTMAVAYIQFHWKLAFDAGFFPLVNKGELALLYCFLFLFIACRGPGRFSVDGARGARQG
jgi:putative oxidoreductase